MAIPRIPGPPPGFFTSGPSAYTVSPERRGPGTRWLINIGGRYLRSDQLQRAHPVGTTEYRFLRLLGWSVIAANRIAKASYHIDPPPPDLPGEHQVWLLSAPSASACATYANQSLCAGVKMLGVGDYGLQQQLTIENLRRVEMDGHEPAFYGTLTNRRGDALLGYFDGQLATVRVTFRDVS